MNTIRSATVLNAALRTDFASFIRKCFAELNGDRAYLPNWHVQAIAFQLEQCRIGANKRLIINLPPRSLKSLCVSIAFPAFVIGHDPSKRFINVSYSHELGAKFSANFRQIVNSEWYRRIFPRVRAARDVEGEFETTLGGGRVGISITGSLTGRGADIIVIDDPSKAEDASSRAALEKVNEYYKSTLLTRLDQKTDGVIILVMQRLHEEDLAGQLLKQGGWMHLNLPAIAPAAERIQLAKDRWYERKEGELLHPAREPRETLDEMMRSMGAEKFQAQYQQAPVPAGGNIVRRDWIRYYKVAPDRTDDTSIVQSWDTAMKGDEIHDYSVCTTWLKKDGKHYLIDLVRKHCNYPSLVQLVLEQYHAFKPDVILMEDKGTGSSLIDELRYNHGVRPIDIVPQGDKETRLSIASISFEQGIVYFPEQARWLEHFQYDSP